MLSIAFNPTQTALLGILLSAGYVVTLAFYRLFLHPLSKFPGPRIAGLTKWYEFYYEVGLKGQYTFRINEMHKKYGPIIRITPDELHINDPDFYDAFYAGNGEMDKYEWMTKYFGTDKSIFTTVSFGHHKLRRAPLNQLFSRRRVLELEPLVREKTKKLLAKFAHYQQNGKPFAINRALMSFSEDVIIEYCFGQCYDTLDIPEFGSNLHDTFKAISQMGHVAMQLAWVPKTMNALPESVTVAVEPTFAAIVRLKKDLKQWVKDVKEGTYQTVRHTTIVTGLLDSKLPAEEKETQRLADEAQIIIGAAVSTMGWTSAVATFHITQDPPIFTKLRKELETAIPDPTAQLEWIQLEKLPYLSACVKEAIRLGIGESNRAPRLAYKPIKYNEWVIPPQTPTSMSIYDVCFNEDIFPNSHAFNPERWIDPARNLDKYMVFFGRGSRMCLGMQLGYAELYHVMASMFRTFEFELYETDITDVEMKHDFSIPLPKLDSKGIRVKVKSTTL